MKKNMIVGMALAMGILAVGAGSASAASSCCNDGKCTDKQVVQKFTQETVALSSAVKAKETELRALYGYEGIDLRKVDEVEAELKALRDKIRVVAEKYGLPTCCLG